MASTVEPSVCLAHCQAPLIEEHMLNPFTAPQWLCSLLTEACRCALQKLLPLVIKTPSECVQSATHQMLAPPTLHVFL